MKNNNLKTILFFFTFILYLNSLFGNFVFDDRKTVLTNPQITPITEIPKIFISPYFYKKPESGIFRPITTTSYAIDFLWNKTNSALFFHLTNVFLHSINVVLIFILVKNLFKNKKLAFFTALLFASHPIHTEAVSWVSGRPELLAFFFSLLSILSFLNNQWLKTNIFFLLALFSKETAIILLPFYLYYFLFIKKQKMSLNTYYLFALSAFIYFSFRWLALGKFIFSNDATIVENPLKYASFLPRIFTGFKITALYLTKLIFPLKLSADYSYNQISITNTFFQPEALIGFCILLITIYSLLFTKKSVIRFSLFFLFIPYLLVSNLILPIGTIIGERLMYFPSLGFCMILGFSFDKCRQKKNIKFITPIIFIIVIVLYSSRTFIRNFDWQNEFRLYSSMAKASPNSVLARSNLGGIYIINKDWQKAKQELLIANSICECYPHSANNLGLVFQHEENLEKTEKWFKKAIEIDNNYQLAYKNLGILYFNQGKYDEALEQFQIILPGNEKNPEILYFIKEVNKKR